LNNFISNTTWDNTKIKQLLWENEYNDLATEITKKKSQADIYILENKQKLIQEIQQKNTGISSQEASKIFDTNYKDLIKWSFVYSFAKNAILESYAEQTKDKNWLWDYNWDDKMLKLYADKMGIWWWKISDKSADFSCEALLFLWTEIIALWAWALTMWVGTVAVNTLVWWTRAYKWIKYLQKAATFANEGKKLYYASRFWAMSIVEWWSFYAWYAWAQSVIEWKNMYSREWLLESILFTWAFKSLQALHTQLGIKLWAESNLWKIVTSWKWKIVIDSVALSAVWLWLDGIIFEPGEWTAEDFIQAFAMAIMFRGMSQLSLKFTKKWERIEVERTVWEVSSEVSTASLWKKEELIKSILKNGWDKIQIWDQMINKLPDWRYKIWDITFDKLDDVIHSLSRELTESQLIQKIIEWWNNKLNTLFNGIAWKEIKIWEKFFRFRKEWTINIIEQKTWAWWKNSITTLTEDEAKQLINRLFTPGVIEKIMWNVKTYMSKTKIEDSVTSKEKETIIKRFWISAWNKLKAEFNMIESGLTSGTKVEGSTWYWPKRTEWWILRTMRNSLVWFQSWNYKTMLWGILLNEWFEIYQHGWVSKRYDEFNVYTDSLDIIANAMFFKYVAIGRALIYKWISETAWYSINNNT
jgi:hypothetical protein